MFCGDSGSSASNIITYIGVPLAVAGILPILYNFLATVATVHKVKGILQRSRLSASAIRSNIFNRVIELEIPRYKLATFDREDPQYWEPQGQLSIIPGGTWTALKWRTRHVATKVQRIQYADEIKQPQAEVEFDELISYLLDLGAIPDPRGWRVLRTNGVWTPKDHCLLSSPDSRNALLTVASLDDSDGHLSLKLNLSATWKRKSCGLPPRWVCLPSLTSPVPDRKVKLNASDTLGASRVPGNPHESPQIEEDFPSRDTKISEKEEHVCMTGTDCELSVNGLLQMAVHKACPHERVAYSSGGQNIDSATPVTEDHDRNHNIDHIRIRRGNSNGVWFASALAAYASASHTISWYIIPDEILRFTTKETVPCGVLVLLGILEDSDAPVWTTTNDDAKTAASQHLRRRDEQRWDMEAEARMPWEQRQDAFRDRSRRERQQWETDERERLQTEQRDLDTRMQQAVQSTPWNNELVAKHSLHWLKSHTDPRIAGLSKVASVGTILHRMIFDVGFSVSICEMLDLWKSWSDHGGITELDFIALKEAGEVFAQAALLVDLIGDAATAQEGTISADLHACIRAYKTVRLG